MQAVPSSPTRRLWLLDKTGVNDLWDGYSRRMYGFNNAVDKVVIRRVEVAY
ncbi:hypothetical protein [Collimonas sp. OK607]|uniref:hypothetical protein n=1 Tax=Collimonas sp. OK607 TaxID=1798194 RepID=UPI00147A06E7|nr:hypothetical protein [Collimonas sp. OK607]